MRTRTPCLVAACVAASRAFATDHFNLESGIPTTVEDIEPTDTGNVELQGFGRYLRFRGAEDRGESEPRIAWGVMRNTQLELSTPLSMGPGSEGGNGDVELSVLRKLWEDRAKTWTPGAALEADVRFPTGVERRGFRNGIDAGLGVLMKKDAGPHSFHFNAGLDWTADRSEEEALRRVAFNVVLGHDAPLAGWVILVSDVVWRQADEKAAEDLWLFETGVRAQLAPSLIGAVGAGVGLNTGREVPIFTITAGLQIGLRQAQ